MHRCLLGYTLYRVVSGECLCRSYRTMAGDYGDFAPEVSLPPPQVASDSDFEDEDDDDGDDDDAFDNDDGDASSTNEMST